MNAKTGWANIRMWRDGGDVWPARLSLDRRHVAMRADNSSGIRSMPRRLLYQLWSRLPVWVQRLVIRLAAPRVTLGVCAVILDARGRLLLAHHPYRRRGWGLPGGFARGNEQPHEALARELREELGVAAVVGPMLCAESEPSTRHVTLYYRATLRATPHDDGEEIDQLSYATPDEARRLLGPNAGEWLDRARTRRAS